MKSIKHGLKNVEKNLEPWKIMKRDEVLGLKLANVMQQCLKWQLLERFLEVEQLLQTEKLEYQFVQELLGKLQ
eukprot:13097391-Heterocapsa_arctica.AAC.1